MNKQELIDIVAKKNNITKALAGKILATIAETVIETVKKDEKVVMVGFGTFCQYKRKARNARNPLTKKIQIVPESSRPKFIPGTAFRNAIDPTFIEKCKEAGRNTK